MITDSFGRNISYLRISLTPNCNLRCVYCMPPEGIPTPNPKKLLTNAEILSFVQQAACLGLRRIRLTGGEPLLRRGLAELVSGIAATPGVEEVSLTTNGMLLEQKVTALAAAGLKRVNISLDTLDAEKFTLITRGGQIQRVLRGIAAAEEAGLLPIKINAVIIRGLNDDELIPFAQLTLEHPWHIRFIELMPVGNAQDWGAGFPASNRRHISVHEMKDRLASFNLQPTNAPTGNGPARTVRIPSAQGTIGFISPLGEHFCANCNRLRLTADGALRPCLLVDKEIHIRDALQDGIDITPLLHEAVACKPEGHKLSQHHYPETRHMAQIGG